MAVVLPPLVELGQRTPIRLARRVRACCAWSRRRPRHPPSSSTSTSGKCLKQESIPAVRAAVTSCILPAASLRSTTCARGDRPRRWPSSCPACSCPKQTPADCLGPPGACGPGSRWHPSAFHPFGPGLGEHVLQGAQAHPRTVRGRASALGQQGPDLADDTGHGGTADPEQQSQDGVRQVMAQVDQGGHHTVDKGQPIPGASLFPRPASDLVTVIFTAISQGWARVAQLSLIATARKMPRPSSEASLAITHQLVIN